MSEAKRVLVTGGNGFLGSYLVEALLAEGCQVVSMARSEQSSLAALGVEVMRGDLCCAEDVNAAVRGCQAVFHVAAKAGVWGSYQQYHDINVLGTQHVLEACRQQGVQDLIYTSTPSVVFTGQEFGGEDESLPYGRNWLCAYAQTKAKAEAAVLGAHGEALRTVALRPHLIWGKGDNHLVPRILERARAGKLKRVGAGKNFVDIIHVKNAASAHVLAWRALAEGKAGGRAYFLSQGEPVNLWDWVNRLLVGMGEPPVTQSLPLPLAYAVGFVCEWVYRAVGKTEDPPMTRFVAVELAKSHYYSIAAAQRDLGYQIEVSTEEGLQELFDEPKG